MFKKLKAFAIAAVIVLLFPVMSLAYVLCGTH